MGNLLKPPSIPVGGVVAILKTAVISQAILKNLSNSKIIEIAEDEEAIVFKNDGHSIISFSHNILYDGARGASRNNTIQVEILDPKNDFESNILAGALKSLFGSGKGVLEEIKRLKNLDILFESDAAKEINANKIATEEFAESIKKKIERLNQYFQSIKDINANSATPTSILEFVDRNLNLNFKSKTKDLEQAKRQLEELASLKDELQAGYVQEIVNVNKDFKALLDREATRLRTDLTPEAFFFYGIGNNYDSWAGPIYGMLYDINYKQLGDGTIRSLVLSYTTIDTLPGLNREKAILKSVPRLISASVPIIPNDFHATITNLYASLFGGAADIAPNNVIVCFPNLNNFLSLYFEEILASVKANFDYKEKDELFQELLRSKFPGTREKSAPLQISEFYNKIHSVKATFQLYEYLGFSIGGRVDPEAIAFALIEANIENTWQTAINDPTLSYVGVTIGQNESATEVFESLFQKLSSLTGFKVEVPFVEMDFKIKSTVQKYRSNLVLSEKDGLFVIGEREFISRYFYALDFVDSPQTNHDFAKNTININEVHGKDQFFLNSSYRLEVSKLFELSDNVDGAFDKLVYSVPDEFAIKDSAKNIIKNNSKIPVFKYGVENSNILEFNLSHDLLYFAALRANFTPTLASLGSPNMLPIKDNSNLKNKIREMSNSWNERNIESSLSYYRSLNYGGEMDELKKDLKSQFQVDFPGLDKSYQDSVISEFVTLMKEMNNNKTVKKILYNEFIQDDMIKRLLLIINTMTSQAITGDIKTVPFFKISKTAHAINFPAFLIINESTVLGQKPHLMNRLMTGVWNIVGFRHVISEGEMASYFKLIKQPFNKPSTYTLARKTTTDIMHERGIIVT